MFHRWLPYGSVVLFLFFLAGCDTNTLDDDTTGDDDTSGDDDSGDDGTGDDAVFCEAGAKTGEAGHTDGLTNDGGLVFNVRTPDDYDPTIGHPLVMVYSPAGGDEDITEQFTGLTPDATDRGYVIAYADHVTPDSWDAIIDLGTIPGEIIELWCIDEERVYITGHSDGGSIATLLGGVDDLMEPRPAAIAPSAAGASGDFLESLDCPAPLPVMVLHSSGDTLFEGMGAEAVAWWSGCSSCAGTLDPLADGCVPYESCDDGVEIQYCEGTAAHGVWPDLNDSMLDFFERNP